MLLLFLSDGEPLKLPESLESLPKSDHFPGQRHRWNTNEVSGGGRLGSYKLCCQLTQLEFDTEI